MLCDIHHHLIYGVDDGAKSLDVAKQMLLTAVRQGVGEICCTSHCTPGYKHFNADAYFRHLETLQTLAKNEGFEVALYSGMEILYTERTLEDLSNGKAFGLNHSRNVLIEFMPETPFLLIKRAVLDLTNAGYSPVLAHVERYEELMKEEHMLRVKQDGAKLQMNAKTVLDSAALFGHHWTKRVLKNGLIDIVASDAHNADKRKCELGDARKLLEKRLGEQRAEQLTGRLPRHLLGL